MKWAWAICLFASAVAAQVTPYTLKVETGPGVIAMTFSLEGNQARIYLPDDVAPGERFSGALEGQPNYVVEFAGQQARVRDGDFHWIMPELRPGAAPGEFLPLILRDVRGRELARASVPVALERPGSDAFRFPKVVGAGSPAPVLGPFDGDSRSTRFEIAGEDAQVLAESVRKIVIRAPQKILGPAPYVLRKGSVERHGSVRSVTVETKAADDSAIGVAVRGLNGLADQIALKLDREYIFIRPADVRPDGGYDTRFPLLGIEPDIAGMEARLVFAQTPHDEVGLILRTPRRDRGKAASEEHAEALRSLAFDPFPILVDFLADYDVGSDAAYAMLAADAERALSLLFASMPGTGANIQRIGFIWFLGHAGPAGAAALTAKAHGEAHAAALRVLAVRASGSEAVELALHTVGLSGSAQDLPLLEQHYQYRSGWSGLQRIQDASEAAMARLGSKEHLEKIRAELVTPLPAQPTPDQAVRVGQLLQKAGFSGQAGLLSAICPHLADPAVVDIDITWDPKLSAMVALNAIANRATPLAEMPRKSLDEWKAYCMGAR
jgi:hypothetical protein